MHFQYISTILAIATLGSCNSQWRQVLKDFNSPQSANTGEGKPVYHSQHDPKPLAVIEKKPWYFHQYGSKRKEIKYGKFRVPNMMVNGGMIDYLQIGAPMPCDDCTITFMQAGLEYPNGTYANADTGLWLHHTVFIDASSPDAVCGHDYYAAGERWFASGNERTPMDLTNGGCVYSFAYPNVELTVYSVLPVGYYVKPGSLQIMLVELMNMMMEEQEAVLTMTFEYVPGRPKPFYKLRPVWLDIAGCKGYSEVPPKTNTTFTYSMSPAYKANLQGAIIGQGGHLHNGGTHIAAYRNGKQMCDSIATYGNATKPMTGGMGSDAADARPKPNSLTWHGGKVKGLYENIISMSGCGAKEYIYIKKRDVIFNKAWYDFNIHAPQLNEDGTIQDIMGITMVFVAEDMSIATVKKYLGKS